MKFRKKGTDYRQADPTAPKLSTSSHKLVILIPTGRGEVTAMHIMFHRWVHITVICSTFCKLQLKMKMLAFWRLDWKINCMSVYYYQPFFNTQNATPTQRCSLLTLILHNPDTSVPSHFKNNLTITLHPAQSPLASVPQHIKLKSKNLFWVWK